MLELNVDLGERSYPIYIGDNVLAAERLAKHLGNRRPVIVTNDTIAPLYLDKVTSLLSHAQPLTFVMPDGEQYKSLTWFEKLNAFLLEHNCGRDTCLIALGGGVIGDLTGFVAACYQRGVPFIQIPTTLLSQVDSSVGGKTAVNHALGKNMIGAFYQPQAVLIDTQVLASLPQREFAAGMAEVIKYGFICDADLVTYLEQHQAQINALSQPHLEHIIHRCCELKAHIVAQDEQEKGLRALLNLGHTFGHAIEAHMGYGVWLHGEAVAAGMVLAARVAQHRGWLNQDELERMQSLIAQYQLPVQYPKQMGCADFVVHMKKDKKNKAGKIRFILPTGFAKCELIDDVTESELEQLFKH